MRVCYLDIEGNLIELGESCLTKTFRRDCLLTLLTIWPGDVSVKRIRPEPNELTLKAVQ